MNEGSVEENNPGPNKTSKTDSSEHISSNRKTPLHLKDPTKQRNSKRGPSGKATSTENPNLEEPVLSIQTLSSKRSLEFTSEQIHSPDVSRWNEPQAPLNTYPEQLWQGFPNVGNTCYMNAILQSLFAIPSFTDDLLMQGVPWEKIPFDALIMCVSQLLALKDICDMETKGELLVNVKRTISAVAETFSGNMQNDAYEFLGYCLDQLKEDMAKLNTALETERETRLDSSSPKTYANKAAPQQAFLCPVVANFEFELQHSIICQACGQIVVKTEPNNYLSINLPQETKLPSFSIQNSFDLFFRAEELEYSCKACKHKTAVGMRKFSRLPRVLIVHLKRYSFDDVWLLVKDNQQVDIPKFLSLSSHCNESTKPPFPIARDVPPGNPQILNLPPEVISEFNKLTPSVKWISETNPEDTEAEAKALKSNAEAGDPLHTYQLVSVVSHLGSSPDSGHYISDVYDFQKQAWFTFNDLQRFHQARLLPKFQPQNHLLLHGFLPSY
ncbi:ubiquitin carboxyl-terminal hydrolase 29 [Phacochoerus africanus]|uniref:ubiquitin carboxyl-terminal hydrolase 29 n=1 Tax=Phacochoerus africanus TaxID=41426 RepID=UPI001FD8B116|nr:ubiquitin carboxyl-terminal hydrolase 29 [Phacochoerus africanus]